MRLGQAIFFGSAAALLTLAAPTLARNSGTHSHAAKTSEAPASASCHAYQQEANGTWTQTKQGVYITDQSFYDESGGIFMPSPHYEQMFISDIK